MGKTALNIVSFDVPFPPSYGGVIDVFYKIQALHGLGVEVHLHAFDYGRGHQRELEKYCASVHYYKRSSNPFLLLSSRPFVVVSRKKKQLLQKLLSNGYPILFEGLHTSAFLGNPALNGRCQMVRMHNIEHDYYGGLAKVERNWLKRIYFRMEAKKLKHYQAQLSKVQGAFSISNEDHRYLNTLIDSVQLLPVFHSSIELNPLEGKGDFALYHGNLAVGENNEAALFLVEKVFNDLPFKLMVAGSKPSSALRQACAKANNVELVEDLSSEGITNLLREAHINVLPTFQATGIKLKLILALFQGRYCIANNAMIDNTGLEDLCVKANSSEEWKASVTALFGQSFSGEDRNQRTKVLERFNNTANAQKLLNWMHQWCSNLDQAG